MITGGLARFEELLPHEAQACISRSPVAYLPLGNIEWHGVHLPLGTDALKVYELCVRVAHKTGGIIMPATYLAAGGVPFPWTLAIAIDTLEALLSEVFENLARFGFKVIIAISGHYSMDQYLAIKRTSLQVMKHANCWIYAIPEIELTFDQGYRGEHAAKWETSLMWALRPELVEMSRLTDGPDSETQLGISGKDPRQYASREAGEQMAEVIVSRLSRVVLRFLRENLASDRDLFLEALSKQVDFLAIRYQKYKGMAWESCPPLMTPQYIEFLDHLWQGHYHAAKEMGETILADS